MHNNTRKKLLFITFTKGQIFFIKNIIQEKKDYDCYMITTIKDNNLDFKKSNVLFLEKINSLKNIDFQRKKKIETFLQLIDSNNSELEIFISHFLNITSNYIYNRYINKKNIIFSNYPDGMLTFNNYKVSYFNKSNIQKFFIAKLLGMKYKLINGSIDNPFNIVKNIYTHLPQLTSSKKNQTLRKIEFEKDSINGENIIILGHANQKKNILLTDSITSIIKKYNKKIYYKAHPSINLEDDFFYKDLKKQLNIELIHNNEAIELLLKDFKIKYVFAVASSALVNLKLLYSDIECFSLFLDEYIEKKYINVYQKIFIELKVYIVKKND